MDEPNVNWKFVWTLSKDMTENGLSDLIDIGSCPLYVINGAFQTGSMTSSWNLKEILKAEWQIIYDSPARRKEFYVNYKLYCISFATLCHTFGWK